MCALPEDASLFTDVLNLPDADIDRFESASAVRAGLVTELRHSCATMRAAVAEHHAVKLIGILHIDQVDVVDGLMCFSAGIVAGRGLGVNRAEVTVHSSTGFKQEPEGQQRRNSTPFPPPSPSLANVPIQYGLIIKILDMFFSCKHYRRLQNIHS